MTTFQIISLAVLAIVALVQFGVPAIPKKQNVMAQIEQVIAIRNSTSSPEVVNACKALLQALLF